MPVITFTEDFNTIDDAEDVSTWDGWGNNTGKWDDEGDIYIEGTQSVGMQPNQTGDSGWGVDIDPSTFNATTNLITIWVFITPGFVNTSSSNGVYVRVGSGAAWTDYAYDYLVGGSDVAWVGKGWHLIVLDANRTTNRTQVSTNAPTLTAVRRVGVGFNVAATATKSTIIAIDIMQYGSYLEVTGPSSSDPGGNGLDFNDNGVSADTITRDDAGSFVTDGWENGDTCVVTGTTYNDGEYTVTTVAAATLTLSSGDLAQTETNVTAAIIYSVVGFQDIVDKDQADDSWFGMVTKSSNAEFEINGPLIIGDQSGALDIYFRTRSEKAVFADQPNDASLTVIEDTGETLFNVGDSSGTGDTRVGYSGTIFSQDDTFNTATADIDLSDTVTLCDAFGSVFLAIKGGVAFAADTSHHVTNCSFDGCGQITLGSVEARNLTFSGYAGGGDAALLWNENIDIENSRFLANTQGIEHPSAAGTPYTYTSLLFSGNTYDVNNTSGSSITITKAGTPVSDPSTYTGSTVTFQASVTITIAVQDADTNPITGVQTAVYKTSDRTQIMNEDTVTGGIATEVYTGSTPVAVEIRCRKASSGATKYINFSTLATLSGTTFDLLVTMYEDPNNNATS